MEQNLGSESDILKGYGSISWFFLNHSIGPSFYDVMDPSQTEQGLRIRNRFLWSDIDPVFEMRSYPDQDSKYGNIWISSKHQGLESL